jgi:hypothetical protein
MKPIAEFDETACAHATPYAWQLAPEAPSSSITLAEKLYSISLES